ncbi:MAG: carboxypeptidase-like regulatory domain-containing protein [Treponema sp.]|nr:carboxypeptidase-like regulatory domain-containing protein [Treponema sp.]
MKRKSLVFVGMLAMVLAFGLTIVGCENSSDTSTSTPIVEAGKGVLGQVGGVIYDTVTLDPVADVTIRIGDKSATTDEAGLYTITDLTPGEYPVVIVKDGYTSFISGRVTVLAGQYKNDDPFGEWEAFQAQLTALQDWAKDFPDAVAPANDGTWSYAGNGVYVSDGGTAAVQYENGQFTVIDYKMDYTYRYAQVYNVQIAPLSASLTGKINVVASQYIENNIIPVSVPIKDDVEIFFQASTGISYGPVKTTGGKFFIEKLPAGVALTVRISSFEQGDHSYVVSSDLGVDTLRRDADGILTLFSTATAIGKDTTDLGQLYLFAVPNVTFVTAASVGTKEAPVAVKGEGAKIVFTFSKPIDPATINTISLGGQTLGAALSNENKTLTLTPNTTTITQQFGYSDPISGKYNGTLSLSSVTATDGSRVYPNLFDVYTTPSIALVSWEIVSAANAARTAVIEYGGAVKLTFSKPISSDPTTVLASIGNGNVNAFKVDGADLWIYHDGKTPLTNSNVTYTVQAAADFTDTIANGSLTLGLVTEKALTIKAVNDTVFTWTDIAGGSDGIHDTSISIKQDKNIVIELEKDYAENPFTKVEFSYTKDANYTRIVPDDEAHALVTWSNRRLTIAPTNLLAPVTGVADDNFAVKLYYTENGESVTKTIWFKVSELGPSDVPAKSAKTAGAVAKRDIAYDANNFTVTLVPGAVAFDQNYAVDYKPYDGEYADTGAEIAVNKGIAVLQVSDPIARTSFTNIPGDGRVNFRVSGVDSYGFYLETKADLTIADPRELNIIAINDTAFTWTDIAGGSDGIHDTSITIKENQNIVIELEQAYAANPATVDFSYTGNGYTNSIPTTGTRGFATQVWSLDKKTLTITPSALLTTEADGTTNYFAVTLSYDFEGQSKTQEVNFKVESLGSYTDTSAKPFTVSGGTLRAVLDTGNQANPTTINLSITSALWGGNYTVELKQGAGIFNTVASSAALSTTISQGSDPSLWTNPLATEGTLTFRISGVNEYGFEIQSVQVTF